MTYLYPFHFIFFAVFSQSAGDRTEADNEASGKWQHPDKAITKNLYNFLKHDTAYYLNRSIMHC